MTFRVGDIVVLKTGNSPQKVRSVSRRFDRIKAEYLTQIETYGEGLGYVPVVWRDAEDYEFYKPSSNPNYSSNQEENAMPKLYQTKEEPIRFGTKIAVNSKGQIVLEMKGKDGNVEAFDPKAIEEVLPYTVRVKTLSGSKAVSRDLQVPEGSVDKGDILCSKSEGVWWLVTAVNTKCSSAGKASGTWLKMNTSTVNLKLSEDDNNEGDDDEDSL